jgi:hypothetical protein
MYFTVFRERGLVMYEANVLQYIAKQFLAIDCPDPDKSVQEYCKDL